MPKKANVYKSSKKKKGWKTSYGSYSTYKGDRHFVLTPVAGGRTRPKP